MYVCMQKVNFDGGVSKKCNYDFVIPSDTCVAWSGKLCIDYCQLYSSRQRMTVER